MSYSNNVVILTKKYIIDLLNSLIFSNTLSWEEEDQFDYLPILHKDEEEHTEQRAALLVHKKYPLALRLVVSFTQDDEFKKVCYRLKSINDDIYVDDMDKTVRPFDSLKVDFAISDLNLSIKDDSSLSFYDFYGKSSPRVFNLLKFLLESDLVVLRDPKVFADIILDEGTLPPISSDRHFDPVFEVM